MNVESSSNMSGFIKGNYDHLNGAMTRSFDKRNKADLETEKSVNANVNFFINPIQAQLVTSPKDKRRPSQKNSEKQVSNFLMPPDHTNTKDQLIIDPKKIKFKQQNSFKIKKG